MPNRTLIYVFAAMALAVVAGLSTGTDQALWGVTAYQIYNLIGQLFLNALSLVVVPLVISSIITGAARMGSDSYRELGAKTFGFFLLVTFLAVCVGAVVMLLVQPGWGAIPPQAVTAEVFNEQQALFPKIEQVLLRMVPPNVFAAAAQGQMLGLILFCLVFGTLVSRIDPQLSQLLLSFWQAVFQVMMRMTHFVMKALPIGVFGLVAKVVASTGSDAVLPVAFFFLSVLAALLFFALGIIPILLKAWGHINPFKFYQKLAPTLLTAFTTSSSSAALPILLETMERRMGVSNRICSFSIPLGAAISMAGTALYIGAVVLFVGQVYGVAVDGAHLFLVGLMAVLTSFGMAGVPSASLVSIVMILQMLGLPGEGVALVLPVERLLDMCRTVVNVSGNATCTLLVAKSEGEALALTPVH